MYTVDYFIKKFQEIPEEKHGKGSSGCAYWHCGLFDGGNRDKEAVALSDLFIQHFPNENHTHPATNDFYHEKTSWFVVRINDGTKTKYQQPTPKQRILAALYDIKKMQQPAVKEPIVKEVIRYVSVDPVIKEMEVVLS